MAGLGVLGALACLDPEVPEVVTGDWGGEHLGMAATATGATLEYDCAEGLITEPIRPDSRGRFSATGLHFPGHGGPIRIGDPQEQHPARYDGTVGGITLRITVTLTDSGTVIGSFTLTRGGSPHVLKCL
jgi:hypothetical protein